MSSQTMNNSVFLSLIEKYEGTKSNLYKDMCVRLDCYNYVFIPVFDEFNKLMSGDISKKTELLRIYGKPNDISNIWNAKNSDLLLALILKYGGNKGILYGDMAVIFRCYDYVFDNIGYQQKEKMEQKLWVGRQPTFSN
jgi:hypothetical protein